MNLLEVFDRKVDVVEVWVRLAKVTVSLRAVERQRHIATSELVPPGRDPHTGLLQEGRVELRRRLDIVHGHDHAIQSERRHGAHATVPFQRKQEGTLKCPSGRRLANMGESSRERAACPLYTAIGVVAGRWKPMLFQRLSSRPHGFGELRRSMPEVSAKVLREQLQRMEADGLVVKRSLTPATRGVRYSVSRYGRTLGPVFETLCRWGRRHVVRSGADRGTLVVAPRTSGLDGVT